VSWIWCLIFTRCVKRGPEGEEGGARRGYGNGGGDGGGGGDFLKANVGGGG